MKPTITETLGGYEFEFNNGLVAEVKRLHSHRDGRITGDITFLLSDKVDTQGATSKFLTIYPPTQINIMAARSRKELANALQLKLNQAIGEEAIEVYPCDLIIDQLCYGVQDRIRQGEPTQELWTHQDVKPPEYLLEPILFKGLPTVIFGEKGVAKSTLSLALYTCLTLPWEDNPLELTPPNHAVKTMILDWETEQDIVLWSLKRLQEGSGLPHFPLYYRRCNLPLKDDLEQIQKALKSRDIEAVIIDSLGAAAGSDDLKGKDSALGYFEALRSLKVSSISLAQTSKNQDDKRKTIFGSTYFTYYARNIFELCKSDDTDVMRIALFHRSSNLSKLYNPMGFRIDYNGNKMEIKREAVSYGEFIKKISGQASLLESLKVSPKSARELAEDIGWAESSTRVLLSRLKKQGRVINLPDKTWGLVVVSS